jgi:hypothetical protein
MIKLLFNYSFYSHPEIGNFSATRSRPSEPVQGSGSQLESAHRVCGGSPENRRVTWLSHKTKTEGSADGDRIRVRREASMPSDAWRVLTQNPHPAPSTQQAERSWLNTRTDSKACQSIFLKLTKDNTVKYQSLELAGWYQTVPYLRLKAM